MWVRVCAWEKKRRFEIRFAAGRGEAGATQFGLFCPPRFLLSVAGRRAPLHTLGVKAGVRARGKAVTRSRATRLILTPYHISISMKQNKDIHNGNKKELQKKWSFRCLFAFLSNRLSEHKHLYLAYRAA